MLPSLEKRRKCIPVLLTPKHFNENILLIARPQHCREVTEPYRNDIFRGTRTTKETVYIQERLEQQKGRVYSKFCSRETDCVF